MELRIWLRGRDVASCVSTAMLREEYGFHGIERQAAGIYGERVKYRFATEKNRNFVLMRRTGH
jgi:hypothetical protein